MMKVRFIVEMLNGSIGESIAWVTLHMPLSHVARRFGEGVTYEILEVRP